MLDALRNISILNNFLQNVTCSMWVQTSSSPESTHLLHLRVESAQGKANEPNPEEIFSAGEVFLFYEWNTCIINLTDLHAPTKNFQHRRCFIFIRKFDLSCSQAFLFSKDPSFHRNYRSDPWSNASVDDSRTSWTSCRSGQPFFSVSPIRCRFQS